jgi:hypothetical protein
METPSGVVDGSNRQFSLSRPASPPASLLLYRNGMLQKQGLDYTLAGSAITFVAVATPQPGDVLIASYRLVDVGNPSVFGEVLCSSAGAATSATASTRLGGCTIGANVLKPGDRVEIRYSFSHEGSTTGFTFEAKWGTTSLVNRTATASETVTGGRTGVAVYIGGAQWDSQSWGANLALSAGAGMAADPGASAVQIDFFGQMAETTAETVTLRNYTVLRYPQQPGS